MQTQVGFEQVGRLHSEKAKAILEAYMKRHERIASDMREARGHVMRNENGEVVLERKFFFQKVESDWRDAAKWLHKIACGEDAKWGAPKQDADKAVDVQMNGKTFSGRDVCLVAHIAHGTSVARLRAAFGEEAVSRMLGAPRTPMEVVKYKLLESKIAKLREEAYARRQAVWDAMKDDETISEGVHYEKIEIAGGVNVVRVVRKSPDSIEVECEKLVDELRKSAEM